MQIFKCVIEAEVKDVLEIKCVIINVFTDRIFFFEGASNAGAIAAAVIGVLATLAVFAGIIWWKKCKSLCTRCL